MAKALVIGASGGIGRALVAELETRGDHVTTLSRKGDGLDVRDPDAVARSMDGLEGPFATVMVATGILAPEGLSPEKSLDAVDADAMAETIRVNAIGPLLVLRHLAGLLAEDAKVGVLTARVGSIGDNRTGGWYSYRMSKAAANMAVRGAAIEIGRKRKQAVIVALHPGTVETAFTADYTGRDKLTPAEAAAKLLDVLAGLGPAQSGEFYDYSGEAVQW